jgi:hypothetical protein
MAKLEKKSVDTRSFPEICKSLSNAEWILIRDRIAASTGKSESAVYYWRDGSVIPGSILDRKAVAEIVSRVLKIKTNHRMLFPEQL